MIIIAKTLKQKVKANENIREKLIDIILKVAMAHHDDISKSDEDAACNAADEILKEFPVLTFLLVPENQDGLCYYCNEMTDSLIGNPTWWPLKFPHKDDPGKVKHHHTGCVMQRLNDYEKLKKINSTEIENKYTIKEIVEIIKDATVSYNDIVYKWNNCDRLLTSDAGFAYIAEYFLNHMKAKKK